MTILTHYSEMDTAVLDVLADGQWHPCNKIWSQLIARNTNSSNKLSRRNMMLSLNDLSEKGILIKGNNESYRFHTEELESWRSYSPTLDHSSPHMRPRYFGGIIEDDGWAYAPLIPKHLVFFKSEGLTRRELSEITGVNEEDIFVNEEGLCRIYAPDRKPFDIITELKNNHPEYHISSIRIEENLKRRNIHDFPPQYLSDMCKHYGQFAKVLLRGQMSSIRKHLPEDDDAQQQIYLWVIEAIKRYDASTSIPFAAYLSTNIRKWVYDLNRKAYGRSIADKELKHARVVNKFRQEHERVPNVEELALLLNQTVESTKQEQQEIDTVINLRNQQALEYEDYERPLPAHTSTEENIETLVEASDLSRLITAATHSPLRSQPRNLIGLVATYYNTWGVRNMDRTVKAWMRSKSTSQAMHTLMIDIRSQMRDLESGIHAQPKERTPNS